MTRNRPSTPVVYRVLAKCVIEPDGCWTFNGSRIRGGYGKIGTGGKTTQLTHRVMYQELVGPIPQGLDLDHLCRNRSCCNPGHLEPVTRSVNLKRGIGGGAYQRQKTHCPQGHPYDEQNTYRSRQGSRTCRQCTSRKGRALSAARRAASRRLDPEGQESP